MKCINKLPGDITFKGIIFYPGKETEVSEEIFKELLAYYPGKFSMVIGDNIEFNGSMLPEDIKIPDDQTLLTIQDTPEDATEEKVAIRRGRKPKNK